MVRSFLTACVVLTLAAGAYAFPERGSRNSKPADVPAADGSVLETAQPDASGPESTRAESSPSPAPAGRSARTRAVRNAGKERAPAPERTAKEPSPAAEEPPAPVTAPPAPVQPQQTASTEVSPPVASPVPAMPEMAADFPVMRALGGIGIVLTLMIGGFFATRKFAPQLFQKPQAQKTLKVVETMQMGDKRSIAIVQVGEKRLLLGNTSSRITLLAMLESTSQGELTGLSEPTPRRSQSLGGSFRNVFELEKRPAAPRSPGVQKTIAPDIRAKMRQLRESLEQ